MARERDGLLGQKKLKRLRTIQHRLRRLSCRLPFVCAVFSIPLMLVYLLTSGPAPIDSTKTVSTAEERTRGSSSSNNRNFDATLESANSISEPETTDNPLPEMESWKTSSTLSVSQVTDKIMYWKHNKRVPKPESELLPRKGHEQYLTFEIDRGGFNNIRMQLEMMVHLALMTGRTFVFTLPHAWYLLDGTGNEIGGYFDEDALREVLTVIDAAEYLRRMNVPEGDKRYTDVTAMNAWLRQQDGAFCPQWDPGNQALVVPNVAEAQTRTMPPLETFLAGRSAIEIDDALSAYQTLHFRSDYEQHYRLLAVPCTFIYFSSVEWERYHHAVIRDHFHYKPALFGFAAPLIHALLVGLGPYNALHIRRNDFQFKEVWISPEKIAENIRQLVDPNMPLYVATDVKNLTSLEGLRTVYPTVRFLNDFMHLLPQDINPNYVGMVDQLVCSAAQRFVGTDLSTFSANIVRMRAFMPYDVAPDKQLYVNTDANVGDAFIDGWRTFATWMELPHLPKWDGAYTWARDFFMAWNLD